MQTHGYRPNCVSNQNMAEGLPTVAGTAGSAPTEGGHDVLARARALFPEVSPQDAFMAPRWYSEQQAWIENPLHAANIAYNHPIGLRMRGPLDVDTLLTSLDDVGRCQSVLRSVFRRVEGHVIQIIPEWRGPIPVVVVDLSSDCEPEREAQAREIVAERVKHPIDLRCGPVMSGTLFRLSNMDHILVLLTHHLVCDDWSAAILIDELHTNYKAQSSNQRFPLRNLTVGYGDFVRWLATRLTNERLQRRVDFWRQNLDRDQDFYYLPTDYPRLGSRTYRGRCESAALSEEFSEAIVRLSRRERTSPFMVLFTAFQCLLQRFSGRDDIGVGSCVANRSMVGSGRLVGKFSNMIILRTDLSGAPTLREVLRRVREKTLISYSYEDVPFGQLVESLMPKGDIVPAPMFQALFVMPIQPKRVASAGDVSFDLFPVHSHTTTYELNVWVRGESSFRIDFHYDSDLFGCGTIKKLLQGYRAILRAMVTDLDLSLSRVPIRV